jgi:hypothetical protein
VSHGWRVVVFCLVAAVLPWGLGVFGAGAALILPAVGAAIVVAARGR